MRVKTLLWLFAVLVSPALIHAEDMTKAVQKAVEESTLSQIGGLPFHLKAELAASQHPDSHPGLTGTIEVWWASPTHWRAEVRSPDFHQIAIVDGNREWQRNEGDYFPDWLRNLSTELISPVPDLQVSLQGVKTAEVLKIAAQTNIDWEKQNGQGDAQANARGYIALMNKTGLLFYCGGLGWNAVFRDYQPFHGHLIARKVSGGSPEVTADVTTLEDLGPVAHEFLDASQPGTDPIIRTVFMTQDELQANLLPTSPIVWPPVQDGSMEGGVSTEFTIDRAGHVRDLGYIVSENQGVNETGRSAYSAMQFRPIIVNGQTVQATVRWTIPFKTTRPAGVEIFDSAKIFFERGSRLDFPSGGGLAYRMQAEFEVQDRSGRIQKGGYEDTWVSNTQWRREAWIEGGRLQRSRSGDDYYLLAEGQNAPSLRFVLKALEPIPDMASFVESDWRIRREMISGQRAIRVASGREADDGRLDPQSRGYWFDESGNLLQSHCAGYEIRQSDFAEFGSVKLARHILVNSSDGALAMDLHIKKIEPSEQKAPQHFVLKGHKWDHNFTDEAR